MSVAALVQPQTPVEHRDRLFIGEIRRDWEPKRVEGRVCRDSYVVTHPSVMSPLSPQYLLLHTLLQQAFLRGILPEATTIDAYAEGSPLVRNRGFAFVSFPDVGSAIRAREKLLSSPVKMGGRALTVDWARAEHTVPAEIMKTISNLFVRNITPGTSEQALKELFGGEDALKAHAVGKRMPVAQTTAQEPPPLETCRPNKHTEQSYFAPRDRVARIKSMREDDMRKFAVDMEKEVFAEEMEQPQLLQHKRALERIDLKRGVARVKIQRTYGFVRFHKRVQAELAKEKHNGAVLNGSCLEVSWARPPPPGRVLKKSPPLSKHNLITMPHVLPQPIQHGFEGFPLLQVEQPLFTPPVLDIPLLTPASTPLTTPAAPAGSTMPFLFVAPQPQHPMTITGVPEQPNLIKAFSERIRTHGYGDVRVITSAVVINNLIFYVTTILIGYIRLDGPLAPSKLEAEQNAIIFASNYLNLPI